MKKNKESIRQYTLKGKFAFCIARTKNNTEYELRVLYYRSL